MINSKGLSAAPSGARAGLVGAAAAEDDADGAPEDDEVEGEGPVVDVVEVEPDGVVPGQLRTPGDLPEPGHAGADEQPAADVAEEVAVVGGQRARPDQRHLALEDVDQLRQLVERGLAQEAADRGDPRVILDLEEQTVGLVLVDQV